MKKEIIIFTILVVIFLLFILPKELDEPKEFTKEKIASDYSNLLFNYKVIRYPTGAEIVNTATENIDVGVVTDPWNLKFGTIPGNNSYVKRYVGVTNLKEKYNKVKLKVYGNITPLVNFSKNDFVLDENESTVVEVNFHTDSAEFGNYTGEIDLVIKVPKYDFLKIIT